MRRQRRRLRAELGEYVAQTAAALFAEPFAKELAEVDVFDACAAGTGVKLSTGGPRPPRCACRSAAGPMVSKDRAVAVVQLPLFRVIEHVEGPLHLLKLLGGRLVVGIHVGMVLPSQFAVGLLDVGLRGVSGNTESFV